MKRQLEIVCGKRCSGKTSYVISKLKNETTNDVCIFVLTSNDIVPNQWIEAFEDVNRPIVIQKYSISMLKWLANNKTNVYIVLDDIRLNVESQELLSEFVRYGNNSKVILITQYLKKLDEFLDDVNEVVCCGDMSTNSQQILEKWNLTNHS